MKSNYDILGNHIRLIDTRNRESITDRVLGINIDKFFMPSVANVIGTDLSKYKLITKGKFSSLERTDMERIYPYYGAVSIVDYVDDYIFDGEYLLVSEDGIYVVDENGHPLIQHISGKFWANNHAHILKGKSGFNEDSLYLFLANTNMAPIVTGAAQPKINQANLKSFPITIPDSETMLKFNNIIQPFFDQRLTNESEIKKLEALQSLLLTRLVD